MTTNNSLGLTRYVGTVLNRMMNRANCEDGLASFCTESQSLENLYGEVLGEMEPKNYGKAIAIVRINYQKSINEIAGLKPEDVIDIESGYLHPSTNALICYANALGLSLDDFLAKVKNHV